MYPLGQRGEHVVDVQGFGDVVVHAAGQRPLAVPRHGVGSHGDHRQIRPAWLLTYLAGRGITVHHRHLAVHQHTIEVCVTLQLVERFCAVNGQAQLDPGALQQFTGQLAVQLIVFDQQQSRATQAGHGAGTLAESRAGPGIGLGDLAEHRAQRLKQSGRRHRFGQYHRQMNAVPTGLFAGFLATERRDHDHRRRLRQFGGLHLPHRFHAVHARHAPIHQHQIIGQHLRFGVHQHGQCGPAALRDVHLHAKTARHAGQDLPRAGVVIDHQHTAAQQFVGGHHAP
ncbi:hypothetical protein D3C72_575370 [compost metagenome]